jgi:hypothetical protein
MCGWRRWQFHLAIDGRDQGVFDSFQPLAGQSQIIRVSSFITFKFFERIVSQIIVDAARRVKRLVKEFSNTP